MQNSDQRHISLDAMRGFAVMGILAMNIIGFAMPEWAYISPAAYGTDTLADKIAWAFSFVLIDGKMRGLFSLLFGASMMLIIDRAVAKGESAAQVHYRRMAWLALFGLAHYFFIWFGDILFLYAIIGMIAFRFRNWPPAGLIKVALIIFVVGLALWGLQFGGLQLFQYFATRADATAGMARQFRELMDSADLAFNVAPDLALHRGSYAAITMSKLDDWAAPLLLVVQSASETLPLMMIGMAMQKSGFLTGAWAAADYRRWAMRMVPVGLLLTLALAVWMVAVDFDRITALAVFYFWGGIPRMLLTIGYAALLLLLIGHYRNQPMLARVAAAGRAAFSNYLGTSIVMTAIFYGYGFGLFGHVGRAGLWVFVLGAWAVMLLWSKPWLMTFHYGPLEWLWRSLARGKMQAMLD
ncbi:MAG: DUF418 domain-containing protein [Sphingomonadaceae bacterium]|jgi:uncharacterized protein|uniref:DUF418 domain-containing protein n=1 Tax=Sphingorhabdus sp. TaxID=1902408 RepID=UPI002FDA1F92|nr:DUF418 domain-containing protein [Sphingomonadaceae bacterium]